MRAYGMTKQQHADADVAGSIENARATRTYNLAGRSGDARAYRSLRNGKKWQKRRAIKRQARIEGKQVCQDFDGDPT